jgi:hypothetical protein
MARVDPRSPREIASFATKFEADAVAGVIDAEGIDATVFGRGGAVSGWMDGIGEWAVMVPVEEANRARQVVLEARETQGESAALVYCPGCGYSMMGLREAKRCPECGQDLDAARMDLRVRGVKQAPEVVEGGPPTAWKWLMIGIGICVVAGLLSFGQAEVYLWGFSAALGLIVFVVGSLALVRRSLRRKALDQREM